MLSLVLGLHAPGLNSMSKLARREKTDVPKTRAYYDSVLFPSFPLLSPPLSLPSPYPLPSPPPFRLAKHGIRKPRDAHERPDRENLQHLGGCYEHVSHGQ